MATIGIRRDVVGERTNLANTADAPVSGGPIVCIRAIAMINSRCTECKIVKPFKIKTLIAFHIGCG
jgi:hypothetical protein